ncbi:Glycine/D-amino acid oxidase [Polaromonas sp. OV174]|uniref:NAD(P)/FAD-dependent oxidoreductase n=1 Tax=Polaromonas sp. OV174 TaxID=1855300 RepID=UPI0008E1E8CE|nr:FAD-binding oxidoreductase [Polaromonas sp. OV174]SFC70812.1 Glycine/D-amino acid oxidase [Polaromonas sp. OV174]
MDLLENCKLTPYWWDDVPRPVVVDNPLPAQVDVAVIGAGYTGLHAALQTARGGRSTLVLDAEEAGWGCSTRNGGQVSTSIKPSFEQLARRHGAERAGEILREGQRSLAWMGEFVRSEGIACDFHQVGRFHAAHNAAQYAALAARLANQPKGLEIPAHMVPRAEQHGELGSDAYWGGAVYTQHCSVHPARYHQGLLERALAAGAQVQGRCPVAGIECQGDKFLLSTPRGQVLARDVVVATNGYTGKATPWLQRRVIPIGSYMIATEPLPDGLMDRLMPRNRIVSDTRKVVYYYRASPDRRRILFGGRVSHQETNNRVSGPLLHADMVNVFPQLRDVKISHSWSGFVAYTFDELMHVGKHEGMHYAMGYCGAGVGTSSYFGMRVGQQVLGLAEGRTALDGLAFQTRPFYTGNPWFLAPSVRYYRWRDQRPV